MTELLLDSLEVKGYRCFEHLTIEKLGRVNLIVGKNNVGKTALLEALWIYLNQGSHHKVSDILNSRDEDKQLESIARQNIPINWFEVLLTRANGRKKIIEIRGNDNVLTLSKSDSSPFSINNPLKNRVLSSFIETKGLDYSEIIELWDKIELTTREDDVTESMKFILPNLLRVRVRNVQNNERIPFAQVDNVEIPLPLKSLGEGLNRLFGISLALVNCNNGILLIDEIESGLHYSVLPDVWKLIFKTAKDLNVQVFATTHSKDCIEAFTQAAVDDEESEGMLVRLERQGEKIVAKPIAEERLALAISHDVEVR